MNKKENVIAVRLTDEQITKIEKLAEELGLKRSETFRKIIDNIDEEKIINELKKHTETYRDVAFEMSRIGSNINQIARKLNKNEYLTDEDRELLKQLIEKIIQLNEKLRWAI